MKHHHLCYTLSCVGQKEQIKYLVLTRRWKEIKIFCDEGGLFGVIADRTISDEIIDTVMEYLDGNGMFFLRPTDGGSLQIWDKVCFSRIGTADILINDDGSFAVEKDLRRRGELNAV